MIPIPQEIIHEILFPLRDNRMALRRCSLASSSFLRPSRILLFSNIIVSSEDEQKRLSALLKSNPDIGLLVRNFKLCFKELTGKSAWIRSEDAAKNICVTLQMIPLIDEISIWCSGGELRWSSLPESLQASLMDTLRSPQLRSIRLRAIHDIPFDRFCVCPNIKSLFIANAMFDDNLGVAIGPLSESGIVKIAANLNMQMNLRDYTAHVWCSDNVDSVTIILNAAAASLRSVILYPNRLSLLEASRVLGRLNIGGLVNLRSLTVGVSFSFTTQRGSIAQFVGLLKTAHMQTKIEEITCRLQSPVYVAGSDLTIEDDHWASLDSVLLRFSRLRMFSINFHDFHFEYGVRRLSIASFLNEQLVHTRSSGILRILM